MPPFSQTFSDDCNLHLCCPVEICSHTVVHNSGSRPWGRGVVVGFVSSMNKASAF